MPAEGQYYSQDNNSKHFIGIASGVGRTSWYTQTKAYDLYDQTGSKVLSGDHQLTAQTTHSIYQMDVMFPVSSFRMGMGITFEKFALYKMNVESEVFDKDISFMETFRFDKFFLQAEFPTDMIAHQNFMLDINARAGYYGFSMVKSLSLFGERRSGSTYFASIGPVFSTRIYPQIYMYIMPRFEYKYFNNSRIEPNGAIYHNLYSLSMLGGLRVQML